MKFFNRIKQSFKGFTEKVRSVSKEVTQGIKQGFEKIKGVFKKKSRHLLNQQNQRSHHVSIGKI